MFSCFFLQLGWLPIMELEESSHHFQTKPNDNIKPVLPAVKDHYQVPFVIGKDSTSLFWVFFVEMMHSAFCLSVIVGFMLNPVWNTVCHCKVVSQCLLWLVCCCYYHDHTLYTCAGLQSWYMLTFLVLLMCIIQVRLYILKQLHK